MTFQGKNGTGEFHLFGASKEEIKRVRFIEATCPKCGAHINCLPDLGPMILIEGGMLGVPGTGICRCGLEITYTGDEDRG